MPRCGGARVAPGMGSSVFRQPPVVSVEEAIARMRAIGAHIEDREPLGRGDGVASFNHLYLVITTRILAGIRDGFFEDRQFLTVLDVAFANRYLDALRASVEAPEAVPRSWRVLIERRSSPHIWSIQFAVAGVNAHINLDLAVALMRTFDELGRHPDHGTQRRDYENVNRIFALEMQSLRQHFLDDTGDAIDDVVAPLLNLLNNWSVDAARDAAWAVGEHLWLLGWLGLDPEPAVRRIDRMTALAGSFLLTPLR
jgi:hypothetical protein